MNGGRRRLVLGGALAVALMLASGCGGASKVMPKERAVALQQSAETYRKLIRWSDFAAASQYCRARNGEVTPFDAARYRGFKVSTYDVGDAELGADHVEATFNAALTFYSTDTGRAGALRDVQRWWFDATSQRWYLESSLPDFAAAAAAGPLSR